MSSQISLELVEVKWIYSKRISSKLSNIPLIVCVVRVPFSHIFVFVPLWVVEIISVAHLFRRCRWFFSVFVPRESDNKSRDLGKRLPVTSDVLENDWDSEELIYSNKNLDRTMGGEISMGLKGLMAEDAMSHFFFSKIVLLQGWRRYQVIYHMVKSKSL